MINIGVEDVRDNIQHTVFFSGADGYNGQHFRTTIGFPNTPKNLELLTFCVLVLRNGFVAVGHSMCANPENYDRQAGEEAAYENAIDKVLEVMTYGALADLLELVVPTVEAINTPNKARIKAKKKRTSRLQNMITKATKVVDPEAPWGRKKDGTPAKRRGPAPVVHTIGAAIAASESPLI